MLFHCYSIVIPLLFHCYSIVIPLLFHCYSIVIPLLFHCYSIGTNRSNRTNEKVECSPTQPEAIGNTLYDRARIQNAIQQSQALFERPKTLTCHCTFKTHLGLKGRKHRLRDQLAHHQKGKRIQRQTISLQPMFS